MEEDDQVLSPASFNNWGQSSCSLNPSMDKLLFSSESNKFHLSESSMAVIRVRSTVSDHDDCSIFPSINHENLHSSSLYDQDEPISPNSPSFSSSFSSASLSARSSSFSPSDSDSPVSIKLSDSEAQLSLKPSDAGSLPSQRPSDPRVLTSREVSGWLIPCLQILRSKLSSVVSSLFRNYSSKAVAPSILPLAASIAIFWWLNRWFWRLRRRKVETLESLARLSNAIKESDEKIARLLQQVAQMNELLLNHHASLTAKLVDSLEKKKK